MKGSLSDATFFAFDSSRSIYLIAALITTLFCSCPKPVPPEPRVEPLEVTYVWKVDTLVFDIPGVLPPEQVRLQSVWGSSPRSVWAAGHSDIPWGRLWHYDGVQWRPVRNWPMNGNENGVPYVVYPYCVTGFDSLNVFVSCFRWFQNDSAGGGAMVLKWDGTTWYDVPWIGGERAAAGLGWIVPQAGRKLWAVGPLGTVVKYENGFLSQEPVFTDYRLGIFQVAALDNGDVFVNAYKESVYVKTPMGTITKLYKRENGRQWTLLEGKFMGGSDYDGNGLGRGIWSIGNRLFTDNRGVWERVGSSWQYHFAIYGLGSATPVSEADIWVAFGHDLRHRDAQRWTRVDVPALASFQNAFLYGQGWSDGETVFICLQNIDGKTYMLRGRKQ